MKRILGLVVLMSLGWVSGVWGIPGIPYDVAKSVHPGWLVDVGHYSQVDFTTASPSDSLKIKFTGAAAKADIIEFAVSNACSVKVWGHEGVTQKYQLYYSNETFQITAALADSMLIKKQTGITIVVRYWAWRQ